MSTQGSIMNVFDRQAKRMQKDRVAKGYNEEEASVFDYIKDEFGYRLSDRICDIKRNFKTVVDLGCGRGHVTKHLYKDMVETIYQCDISPLMLEQASISPDVPTHKMVVDEEFLPFDESSIDLVVSNLSLHWVNNLPGCLAQIRHILKNDCALVGSMFGGDTLYQLRVSLQLAEIEREGGFAPHISPFTTVSDLGNLLNRAGFTMLTIDIDDVTITYPSMFELMQDLKGMGENNCSWSRKPMLHRDTMIAAGAIYKEMYGNDKGIPATFQVINFIGWKPDPSQPKPAQRGSGEVSLKDLHRVEDLTKQIKELKDEGGSSPQQVDRLKTAAEQLEKDIQKASKIRTEPENNGDEDPRKS
ncbi:NADP dehydrogenase [ubiquinone] 1 alpha subcomplex assembly factor 5-like [Plakobranchus ocellatus]|uniref:Arginine-hydroxylase NDUFAF5, mitochondrial n=1 Tax=Plakobranchus ocellatus TaxID=259542 RepID=A0AAV4CRV6_9GAST|nr:NADP dehydrogenase [ubiquinone] 1 alpha subcomplex assembly factor 5-like [Plakobranchus ocellatus]